MPRPASVRHVLGPCLAACVGACCLAGPAAAQAPLWVRTWDGARTGVTAPPRDLAYWALSDASGNLYIAGASLSNANVPVPPPAPPIPARFQSHDDVAVVKLSPTGDVEWSRTFDFPTQGDDNLTPQTQSGADTPVEAALGADGSVYVLAQAAYRYDTITVNIGNPPVPTQTTTPAFGVGVVKFSPTGTVTWSTTYFPAGITSMNAASLAIGDSGKIYAAYIASSSTGQRNGVLVLNPADGSTTTDLTMNAAGTPSATLPRLVRRGTGGRMYVISTPPSSTGAAALLSVIDDATSTVLTETLSNGPASRGVFGLAISPTTGEVAVSGYVSGTPTGDAMAAKFAADGTHLWTATWDDAIDDGPSSNQSPTAGAVIDEQGNVYIGGIQAPSGSSINDLFAVKFAGTDGAVQWSRVWNGPTGGTEIATERRGLQLRPGGDLIIGGWTRGAASVTGDMNLVALPLNRTTGAIATPLIYDAALSTTSDDQLTAGPLLLADGSLVLAGRALTTARNMDFVVARFPTPCRADFDQSGMRTIDDIFIFLAAWFASDPRSDIDGQNGRTIDDIFIFLNLWFAGC